MLASCLPLLRPFTGRTSKDAAYAAASDKSLVKTKPIAASARTIFALAIALLSATTGHAQNVIAWGNGSQGQTNVPPAATNVVAVAAGAYHSLALRSDGTVVCWGSGAGTNIPANITNATAIAAGMSHSLALLADNSVVAWGDNTYGQTNVPAAATNVVALAAGYYHNLALRADGTVVAWGKNTYGQCNVPTSLSNVVAITAGAEHSMALGADDSLVIWGGSTTYPLSSATNRSPLDDNRHSGHLGRGGPQPGDQTGRRSVHLGIYI